MLTLVICPLLRLILTVCQCCGLTGFRGGSLALQLLELKDTEARVIVPCFKASTVLPEDPRSVPTHMCQLAFNYLELQHHILHTSMVIAFICSRQVIVRLRGAALCGRPRMPSDKIFSLLTGKNFVNDIFQKVFMCQDVGSGQSQGVRWVVGGGHRMALQSLDSGAATFQSAAHSAFGDEISFPGSLVLQASCSASLRQGASFSGCSEISQWQTDSLCQSLPVFAQKMLLSQLQGTLL